MGHGINQDSLRRAIGSTLLYEMMLRTVDPEGLPDKVTLPPWLIAEMCIRDSQNSRSRMMRPSADQMDFMAAEAYLSARTLGITLISKCVYAGVIKNGEPP